MEMLCKQHKFNGFVSRFSYLLAFNDSVHCIFVCVQRSRCFFLLPLSFFRLFHFMCCAIVTKEDEEEKKIVRDAE